MSDVGLALRRIEALDDVAQQALALAWRDSARQRSRLQGRPEQAAALFRERFADLWKGYQWALRDQFAEEVLLMIDDGMASDAYGFEGESSWWRQLANETWLVDLAVDACGWYGSEGDARLALGMYNRYGKRAEWGLHVLIGAFLELPDVDMTICDDYIRVREAARTGLVAFADPLASVPHQLELF